MIKKQPNNLYSHGYDPKDGSITCSFGLVRYSAKEDIEHIALDGLFTADELMEFARYMKECQDENV